MFCVMAVSRLAQEVTADESSHWPLSPPSPTSANLSSKSTPTTYCYRGKNIVTHFKPQGSRTTELVGDLVTTI